MRRFPSPDLARQKAFACNLSTPIVVGWSFYCHQIGLSHHIIITHHYSLVQTNMNTQITALGLRSLSDRALVLQFTCKSFNLRWSSFASSTHTTAWEIKDRMWRGITINHIRKSVDGFWRRNTLNKYVTFAEMNCHKCQYRLIRGCWYNTVDASRNAPAVTAGSRNVEHHFNMQPKTQPTSDQITCHLPIKNTFQEFRFQFFIYVLNSGSWNFPEMWCSNICFVSAPITKQNMANQRSSHRFHQELSYTCLNWCYVFFIYF